MKIFLDANILFSASCPGSRTGKFLTLAAKRAEVVTSAYAVEEARRNLAKHRPGSLPALARWLGRTSLTIGAAALTEVRLPEKDRPILAAAVAARCTHLLTGDFRHFGPLLGHEIGGVRIVSMQMLADEFATRGWVERE